MPRGACLQRCSYPLERNCPSSRWPLVLLLRGSAKLGEVLFITDAIGCFRCHGGFTFSDAVDYQGRAPRPAPFHNTGLYNLPGLLSYPQPNLGIYAHTGLAGDVGKFKAPTLRNVALTAPYMRDGPYAGIGSENPNKDRLVRRLSLSAQNREDLVAFLRSLTDEELIHDPRFSDPW